MRRSKPVTFPLFSFLSLTVVVFITGAVFFWYVRQFYTEKIQFAVQTDALTTVELSSEIVYSLFILAAIFALSVILWFVTLVSLRKSRKALLLNMSERAKAEEFLKQKEQYHNLFRLANDAIVIFEAETENVLDVNDKACEMYGFKREEFIGLSIKSISANVEKGEKQLRELFENGTYQEFETVQFRADGKPLDLVINASIIEYQGKTAVLSINRDISGRKRMENELREREQHLFSVANSAQEAIISADSDGNIIFWNNGARKMFGYTEPEVIGKSLSIIMPERYREAHSAGMMRYIKTGENRVIGKVVELDGLHRDGSEFPLELSLGIWENDDKKYFTGIIRNIAERRKIEQMRIFRAREVALRAEISSIFAVQDESLRENLSKCAEAVVNQLDAALVRIWTLNENETVLELQAGAGIYADTDETPARVPVGESEIGIIAREKREYVTDDVLNDERVGDKEWARQNGLISFAGYPLTIDERLVGVLAMFARSEIAEETLDVLSNIADIIAQSIERKRAVESLEASEQRYRFLGEGIMHQVWTAMPDGRLDYVNQRAVEYFGRAGEELIGDGWQNVVHPEDLPECVKRWQHSLETGANYEVEFRLKRADGEYIWHFGRATAGRDARGNIIKWFGTNSNTQSQKSVEKALQKSEEKFRSFIETTKDWIWAIDAEGNFTYTNPAIETILGYAPEEAINENFLRFVSAEDHAKITRLFQQNVTKKHGWTNLVFRWRHKDESVRFLENTAVPVFNESGELTGFRGTNHDITKRRNTENALRRSQSALNATQDGVFMFSPETLKFFHVNEGAVRQVGYSREELLNMTPLDIKPEFTEKAFRQMLAPLVKGWTSSYFFTTVHRHQDGFDVPVEIILQSVTDEDGEKLFVSMARDITERQRTEKALRESENKMRSLLDSMSEGLLQVDRNEKIEFVNDRFCEMLGYSYEQVLGKSTFDFLYDNEDRKIVLEANRQRVASTAGHYELKLRKSSGEVLYAIVGGAPLINADGEITGTMGVFTDITERKRAEERLVHDAFHDVLTGLANRALFMDHLRMTIERGKSRHSNSYAVLFLDFDRFKVINDSLGHAEGDKLLTQIARRLEASTRTGDLVARLGGDEFVILLNELSDTEEAMLVAKRILNELKSSFNLGGRDIYMSASIGIALSTAGHKCAEDMLRDADIAMYHAKSNGKSQYQVFDRRMHEQASKQLSLETEMRRALESEEFQIYYQPIVNIENRQIKGFEALVRWQHPTQGVISPFEFIPAAEESGLILPLGSWILREGCRQLQIWQERNSDLRNLTISVNLSTKQFSQTDLADEIAGILYDTKLNPNYLRLEITESHVMENSETAIKIMNRLHNLGVRWSLDDFGTGYSSLSYLHRLPFNFLKIDRSFIGQINESEENREIVHTIIKLANNLRMRVIAEGIENEDQLELLKNLGCEYGQGYLFSKPLNADKVEEFITEFHARSAFVLDESIINLEQNM